MKLLSRTSLVIACFSSLLNAAPATQKDPRKVSTPVAHSTAQVRPPKKNPAERGRGLRELNRARRERLEKVRSEKGIGTQRTARGCGCASSTATTKPKRSSRPARQATRTAQKQTARQAKKN